MGPDHLSALETIVDPVVMSDLPTVLWSPHGHDEAAVSLKGMIDVTLLDSDDQPQADAALARAEEELGSSYVVDLAWLRTTPWRERLAATFDPPRRRATLASLEGFKVRHQSGSTASALLLAGWLSSRLHWDIRPLWSADGGGLQGRAYTTGQWYVEIALEPHEQEVPGLAGVTVAWHDGSILSLDRAAGGLHAQERSSDGTERNWLVLGASRGEGGILGEGVRQALLRDPTYRPALGAARELGPDAG
jgi:glucose-6-phosphate dehydrogenase assembly protein OpcA